MAWLCGAGGTHHGQHICCPWCVPCAHLFLASPSHIPCLYLRLGLHECAFLLLLVCAFVHLSQVACVYTRCGPGLPGVVFVSKLKGVHKSEDPCVYSAVYTHPRRQGQGCRLRSAVWQAPEERHGVRAPRQASRVRGQVDLP